VPHASGKSNVSLENVKYGCGEATRSVDLALEVLTTAYRSPRKQHADLEKWAESAAHVPDWLEQGRRAGF
jgi:hypothetical protein